jgi:hypothetical protein
MSDFTPTHRVKSAPFYRSTATGERRDTYEVKVGDLVRVAPADKVDIVGDYFATRENDYSVYLNEECLESLKPEPTPDAPTITRDALIDAARDAGVEYNLATVIADAAENRSK